MRTPISLRASFIGHWRERNFQSRPAARSRFDHQIGADRAHAFPNNSRAQSGSIEFCKREPACEFEAASIILDDQLRNPVVAAKSHQYFPRSAVLPNIYQRLLQDANQFSARARRQGNLLGIGVKAGRDKLVALELVDSVAQALHKLSGLHFDWLYHLHPFTKVQDLFAEKFLQVGDFLKKARAIACSVPSHDFGLHFQSHERLNNPVVKLVRQASPLRGLGARP